jgi:hypothetical protein
MGQIQWVAVGDDQRLALFHKPFVMLKLMFVNTPSRQGADLGSREPPHDASPYGTDEKHGPQS